MALTNKEINLYQLDQELGGKGLIADLNDDKKKLILPSENSNVTEAQLEAAIAAHIAVFSQPSVEEKLANAGLSLDDLKAALGL
jgi:hypothetical protein